MTWKNFERGWRKLSRKLYIAKLEKLRCLQFKQFVCRHSDCAYFNPRELGCKSIYRDHCINESGNDINWGIQRYRHRKKGIERDREWQREATQRAKISIAWRSFRQKENEKERYAIFAFWLRYKSDVQSREMKLWL